MFDIYVYVEDVEGLYRELFSRGAEIVHGPVDQGYGTHEFLFSAPTPTSSALPNRQPKPQAVPP